MRQKKLFLVIVFSLIFVLTSLGTANASGSTKKYASMLTTLTLRAEPNTKSEALKYLKVGDKALILKEQSGWYNVDFNGVTGYISSNTKYVSVAVVQPVSITHTKPNPVGVGKPREPKAVIDTNLPWGQVKSTVHQLVFRSGASVDSTKIRYFDPGETFIILDKTNNDYYSIQDLNGVKGYVSTNASYITAYNVDEFEVPSGDIPLEHPNTTDTPPTTVVNVDSEKAIQAGWLYMGVPYQYGADRNSVASFDCSSFVRRAFLDGVGLDLPWDSRTQATYVKNRTTPIKTWKDLKRGDLIFFTSQSRALDGTKTFDDLMKEVNHVGIYLGDGTMLNSNGGSTGGVQISSISLNYWNTHFLFGGPVLGK